MATPELGIVVRNMGPQSSRETVLRCAQIAEDAGLESLWMTDHIAIPPDDAEGSGGRYLDPLATLCFLAGATSRIRLGTSVLVLPYREALPTAKWVATLQELSGGRLLLGVGVGWMEAEFRALGVPRAERARRSDAVLDLLRRCFDAPDDVVTENGQPFLFRPKPPRPPIYVGGAPPHALHRTLRFGDGWMPMASDPERIAPAAKELLRLAEEQGRPMPEIVAMGGVPLREPGRAAQQLARLAELGVTRFVQGVRYDDADGFAEAARQLGRLRA